MTFSFAESAFTTASADEGWAYKAVCKKGSETAAESTELTIVVKGEDAVIEEPAITCSASPVITAGEALTITADVENVPDGADFIMQPVDGQTGCDAALQNVKGQLNADGNTVTFSVAAGMIKTASPAEGWKLQLGIYS